MPTEASEMFRLGNFGDKHDTVGFQIFSFSTYDRIRKWNEDVNGRDVEKTYFVEVGSTARTINLFAIASTRFEAVC